MTFPDVDFDHCIASNQYGHYCLPADYLHREVPKRLLRGRVYEPATLQLIRRRIGTGDVISGGAFVGDFFPAICEKLVPDALLHSFEPNPVSRAAARMTIALNDLDQVRLSDKAVGDKTERLTLQVGRADGSPIAAAARINPQMAEDDARGVPVEAVPLDTLVAPDRRISILHLDLEGFEVPALEGAARIVRQNAPFTILEGVRPQRQKAFLDTLNKLLGADRYRLVGTMERNSFFKAF